MRLGSFQLPNGASLSYAEYGTSTGNPVLLFHGLVGSICSEGMEESLCGLPVRVIALARPGYGASDYFDMDCVADWGRLLAEFWDHLELWSFDIVGISAGAPYAYSLAALYPDRIGTLYINSGIPAVCFPNVLAQYPAQDAALYRAFRGMSRQEAGQALYSTSLIDRILNIFVRDLTPEEYMDKLNFTQEERDWAALLYSTLAEDQNLSYGDSDGDGYYNTDYGDITFSDAETPVVYYNQTDSRWGNKMYGKSGTIGEAGCGPTALAIAVASLTSNQVTPYDVAQWSVENGYRCEGNGSYHSLIPNGGAHYGLTVTGVGNDSKRLVDALKNGKLVIAIMSKGHFTSSGHFIVLRGVTEGGKILVADPASVKRSNQEWELGIILNEASRRAGSGGPFWVMSA